MTKKVVYLMGAGATHAEIMNLGNEVDATFRSNNGLLISDVSRRVIKAAHKFKPWFKKHEDVFTSTKGAFNIELLISLYETNGIPDDIIRFLKKLVEDDIKGKLSDSRRNKFYLHKALFELHRKIEDRERLLGVISLNYDGVLDEAYQKVFNENPDYCLTAERKTLNAPILKLHGSFNWDRVKIYGKSKQVSIIPLGTNKNYLVPPYNFISGRAFELLVDCDILRILGCSLNQNDTGILQLLFKAHQERGKSFEIQIIDFQPTNGRHPIKNNIGFFPNITEPIELEGTLIDDNAIHEFDVGNPFKIWLRAKALKMLDEQINNTRFLRKCL